MGRTKRKTARAGNRPGTAVQAKGRQRVDEILDAAAGILVEEGYAELSTRKIAARVGIRLSNVQYYFPSKQDLLQALVERSIKDYYDTLQARIAKGSKSPKAQLLYSIDYVLASHARPDVGTLFKELWALAAHDADAARVMDAFYERWRSMAADTVQQLNPKLTRRRAERRAVLIIGMVDGHVLLTGKDSAEPAALKNIAKDMRDAALAIAMAP
jgi:AcrR family transcriptional regulator